MSVEYFGSCLCGDVEFKIDGEFDSFYLCHCKRCRKDTGSAHAANLFSTTAKITWLSGEDNTTLFNLPSTRHVRCFCSVCGSALPSVQMNGKLLVVPAGSLNSQLFIKPNAHIFISSKASWDECLNNIPKWDGAPVE
ncbi:GFA family protein [Zooshikella harenae]|uniref:GFA family protein n=1 Tax=Zooshikella harenae TaxID=2827238 RepID=A0ABS5ZJ56_9GAMM|nr:GFA family protein [Zooshikella harenae]MBU2713265.1 GFA family protein [Zooshikella harenae]